MQGSLVLPSPALGLSVCIWLKLSSPIKCVKSDSRIRSGTEGLRENTRRGHRTALLNVGTSKEGTACSPGRGPWSPGSRKAQVPAV